MEKEYIVIVKKGIDLEVFDAEMAAHQGHGPIPNRQVVIANPRHASRRMTHWMLTDEEANELRNDPRVLEIEIPPEYRNDIEIGLNASQSFNFSKTTQPVNTNANWGLRRTNSATNNYGSSNDPDTQVYEYALDGEGVDIVIQDTGIQADHPEFIDGGAAVDPEYNNGAIINVVGDGSDFFKREVTVNGVRIMGAGTVGGQTAVPDAWLEKVGRMFELFTDPNGAGINKEYQRNLIQTLSGDTGTYHAGLPTIQRVARGAGADYTPNFLTDAGVISWNLTNLFDTHVQNDMVWYLNSTGDGYGDGDIDAQEVIEHVFHTLHMHGLPADDIKLYQFLASDWQTGDLYAAMEEAYDASKWDPSGYQENPDDWKTDADAFEVAAKEYLYLLNFCMFEYTELWDGGSLAPEWTDDMRTQAGIQSNNPLGYAFHNTYIAPVISKPSLATIRSIFQDGNTPAQDNPSLAGASGYVVSSSGGTSRVQQIDWFTASGLPGTMPTSHYTDFHGHGTHCAGIAAGKTYGFAKGAAIYAMKVDGLQGPSDPNGGISVADCFDTIKEWHNNKTNGRPTIVNMSWGYSGTRTQTNPTGGTYRGTPWTYNSETGNELWAAYGIVPQLNSDGLIARRIPVRVASVDTDIEELIDAGVHVVIASGNSYYKIDESTGNDYNNQVDLGNGNEFYHRGSSPYSAEAFIVGNIDSTTTSISGTPRDKTAGSSCKGPGVNIWAPGTDIISSASGTTVFGALTGAYDDNFNLANISGTSMAAPQVAGLACLHLQVKPKLTPAELFNRVVADTKAEIYDTGLDNDYDAFSTSIMGSANRMLYSKYGIQPITVASNITNTNVNTG